MLPKKKTDSFKKMALFSSEKQIKQLFDTDTLDQFMEKAGFWIRRSDKSDEDIAEWVKYAYESPLTHRDDFLPIMPAFKK